MSRLHKPLEPRRNTREAIADDRAELADAGVEREAYADLHVVVEETEDVGERRSAGRQVPSDSVQDEQRVVAVGAAPDVVERQCARQTAITHSVKVELSCHRVLVTGRQSARKGRGKRRTRPVNREKAGVPGA